MREPEAAIPGDGSPKTARGLPGTTVITDWHQIHIPATVVDLESFRAWTDNADFPERENIWWLCGQVWADLSRQQVFTHVLLRGEIYRVLLNITKPEDLGKMLTYGLLLTNRDADFSGSPDGIYFSDAAFDAGRIRLIPDRRCDFTEMQGTPTWCSKW
jgi:hypothetical protein